MLYFERKECKECGSRLWSDYSKNLGLCPECKDIDAEQNLELESNLETHLIDNFTGAKMRTIEQSFNVYSFSELSAEAKKTAIDDNREINIWAGWYEYIYEDARSIAEIFGLNIDKIYFSGFWSQGDGACFTGNYSYKKNSLSLLKSYLGENAEQSEPYRIAKELQEIQRKQFYSVECEIAQRGMYSHSRAMYLSSFDAKRYDDTENDVLRCFRDFADWIYKSLEQEYTYQTSDDAVIERLHEFEFTENGKIFS